MFPEWGEDKLVVHQQADFLAEAIPDHVVNPVALIHLDKSVKELVEPLPLTSSLTLTIEGAV